MRSCLRGGGTEVDLFAIGRENSDSQDGAISIIVATARLHIAARREAQLHN